MKARGWINYKEKKTKGEDNAFYAPAVTVGSVMRNQSELPQSYKILNNTRYIKKHDMTEREENNENKRQTMQMRDTNVATFSLY